MEHHVHSNGLVGVGIAECDGLHGNEVAVVICGPADASATTVRTGDCNSLLAMGGIFKLRYHCQLAWSTHGLGTLQIGKSVLLKRAVTQSRRWMWLVAEWSGEWSRR